MKKSDYSSLPSSPKGPFTWLSEQVARMFNPGAPNGPSVKQAGDKPGQRHDISVRKDGLQTQSVRDREGHFGSERAISVELLRGWGVPIVGESFYQASFRELHKRLAKSPNSDLLEWAEVVADPSNAHSKSGKAVAIYIDGLQVGHIAELIAPLVFDSLMALGGRARARARVHLYTSSGNFRWSSVQVEMAIPPRLSDSAANYKIDTVMYGPRFIELGLFSCEATAGSLVAGLAIGESLVATVNLRSDGSNLLICTVSDEPLLRPININRSEQHELFSARQLAYLTAKIERVEHGFAVGIQATQDAKIVKVRTGDAISPVGNILSSTFQVALSPSNKWLKVRASQFDSSHFQVPQAFQPSENCPRVYFWADVSPHYNDMFTIWGFRASFYQKTIDSLRQQLDSLPNFLVLVRAEYDSAQKKTTFEVDLDFSAAFVSFPARPILPANALTGAKPRIVQPKTHAPKARVEKVQPKPSFAESISKQEMLRGKLRTTHFDYLEDTYLLPCLQELFSANQKEDSKASTLVGGSTFNIEESSAAKEASRKGSSILTTSMVREQLSNELSAMPRYQALMRYENWFTNQGLKDFGGWGFRVPSFDFTRGDVAIIPGAALDERPLFDSISFIADLVGLAESKEGLSKLMSDLGGSTLDTLLIKGELSFRTTQSGLVAEVFRDGLFLGRTPANQSESLAESAKLYGLRKVWVRVDWVSRGRFKAAFAFFVGN